MIGPSIRSVDIMRFTFVGLHPEAFILYHGEKVANDIYRFLTM